MAGTGKKAHTTSHPGGTQNRGVSNYFRPSHVCTNNRVLIQGGVAGPGKKAIQVGPKHKSEQVFETVTGVRQQPGFTQNRVQMPQTKGVSHKASVLNL